MHCVKSVRIRSYSGPYSVWMRKNTDQNNSEYGNFLRSDDVLYSKGICLTNSVHVKAKIHELRKALMKTPSLPCQYKGIIQYKTCLFCS